MSDAEKQLTRDAIRTAIEAEKKCVLYKRIIMVLLLCLIVRS